MRIYVAGPYSNPHPDVVLENVHRALDAGLHLLVLGHTPFVPHLTHWLEKRAIRKHGYSVPYDVWQQFTSSWLAQCEAILYLWSSPGADEELERAIALGIKVFDDLGAVPPAETP